MVAERILIDKVFGANTYPDCVNAGELTEYNTCPCKALENAEGCAVDGTFWCSVATQHGSCPLGKE